MLWGRLVNTKKNEMGVEGIPVLATGASLRTALTRQAFGGGIGEMRRDALLNRI
jgi:hypothetical protein